jgi:5-formyltetrahydrofolate cyclo-ligase
MNSKESIRREAWDLLSEKKVTRFPGAEGRIPNFTGAENCARLLAQSPLWRKANVIKINPDSPQRAIRQRALEEGKIIYMAVPRLHRLKPFIELDPKTLEVSPFWASSIKGATKYGQALLLSNIKKIDLIVCGSVAVNQEGARVGKGGGYSDLEYALLREEGKVDAQTPIVTTVHPLQILKTKMPMTDHDIPLNAIITPEKVISLRPRYQKPRGIYWGKLSQEKIKSIPVLKARNR